MSALDRYLQRLDKRHIGETKKRKLKRLIMEADKKSGEELDKAIAEVRKNNTPANRAKVKKRSVQFYHVLQKTKKRLDKL